MDQHIKSPLQETGVDCKDRDHALGRHAGRHGHGVAFCDADVEKALGVRLGKAVEAGAGFHCRGDGADPRVVAGQVRQGFSTDGTEGFAPAAEGQPGLRVKGGDAVELVRILLGERIPLPFHGVDMHDDRRMELPGPAENVAELIQIVPVHRAQILKAHVFKKTAGPDGLFQVRFQVVDMIVHPGEMAHHAVIILFEPVISGPDADMGKMAGDAAHIPPDGHAVVVEDDDQRFAGGAGVVQALIGQAAGQGAVADDGQHLVILLFQRARPGHAQGDGNGIGCVARDECIVDAFVGLRKAGKAAEGPQGGKQRGAPRQGLVYITLVPHVENQPVHGCVEHAVDGHGQLHRAEVRREMAAGFGYGIHQKSPQLRAKLPALIC